MRIIYGLFTRTGRVASPGVVNPLVGYGLDLEGQEVSDELYLPVEFSEEHLDLGDIDKLINRQTNRELLLAGPIPSERLIGKRISWSWSDSDEFGFDLNSLSGVTGQRDGAIQCLRDGLQGTVTQVTSGKIRMDNGIWYEFPSELNLVYISDECIDLLIP